MKIADPYEILRYEKFKVTEQNALQRERDRKQNGKS